MFDGVEPRVISEDERVLRAARKKIVQGWCQGASNVVHPDGKVQHCMMGAIEWARRGTTPKQITYAARYLRRAIGKCSGNTAASEVTSWNDTPGRKKREVLAAFDLAIEMARNESLKI